MNKIQRVINTLLDKEKITKQDVIEYNSSININKAEWIKIGLVNHWGRPQSDETKKKLSESRTGKPSGNKGRQWIHNMKLKEQRLVMPHEVKPLKKHGWDYGRLPPM